MTTDCELVTRVRQGDVEAFAQLVERYERSVRALALAELRDSHAADDATQAAFLIGYRRLTTLNDGDRFGPWLMQIVRRQVVEVVRGQRIPVAAAIDLAAQVTTDRSAEAWIEQEHLLCLVARLPEHERLLVGLRYFDGHSTAAISEITGRPLGTVTKQLSRALARLRDWCEKEACA